MLKRKIDNITNSLQGIRNSIVQVNSEIANKKALYDILLKAVEDLKRPEDASNGNQMDVVPNDEDVDDDLNVDDSSRGINSRTKDHDDLDTVGDSGAIPTASDEEIVDDDDLAVKQQEEQHEQH